MTRIRCILSLEMLVITIIKNKTLTDKNEIKNGEIK